MAQFWWRDTKGSELLEDKTKSGREEKEKKQSNVQVAIRSIASHVCFQVDQGRE